MNMASIGILLILTVYIYVSTGNAEAAFLNFECKDEKVGQYGQQTLLECVITTLKNDAKVNVVTWKKKDQKDQKPLLLFNRGLLEPKSGYSFAEPSWNVTNMNVSLLITNTAVEHQGDYTCMVMTNSGDGSSSISLKVTAKYNKPTLRSDPEKITRNKNVTLTCESKGYPKGELRWFDEHNKTKNSQTEAKQTENGLFHLSSNLTLEHRSMGSKYTCRVFNASGGKEDEEVVVLPSLQLGDGDPESKGVDSATKIAAPVVVIGSLIVGLLIVMLWIFRRRFQRNHRGVPTYEPDVEEGDLQEKGDNHA